MTSPESLFRNAIDLNRYSTKVAHEIVESFNNIAVESVKKLYELDRLGKGDSHTAARLRSIVAQMKESMDNWTKGSSDLMMKQLQSLSQVQADFAEKELKKLIPKGYRDSIRVNTVEISENFAKSVVTQDPTKFKSPAKGKQLAGFLGEEKLTDSIGANITLPNGNILNKAFSDLGEAQTMLFRSVVRDGLLSGQTTEQMARSLIGSLTFNDPAGLLALAQKGGQLTNPTNHQIRTLVRTSVNQVASASSMQVYKANKELTKKYRYIATLDSRTSAICRSLDGRLFPYDKGPQPPQHFNCRSTIIPEIDYDNLPFDAPPAATRASEFGPIKPGKDGEIKTYGDWLSKQSVETRARVLGGHFNKETKKWEGSFRYYDRLANKYGPQQALSKFVRADGSEVSLEQLQKRYGKPENIKKKPGPKPKPKVAKAPVKTKVQDKVSKYEKEIADIEASIKKSEKLLKDMETKEAQAIAEKKAAAKAKPPSFNQIPYEKMSKDILDIHYEVATEDLAKLAKKKASIKGAAAYAKQKELVDEMAKVLKAKGGKTYSKLKIKVGKVQDPLTNIFKAKDLDQWELEEHWDYWVDKKSQLGVKDIGSWKMDKVNYHLEQIQKAGYKPAEGTYNYLMNLQDSGGLLGPDIYPDVPFEPFKKKLSSQLLPDEKKYKALVKKNKAKLKAKKTEFKRKTKLTTDDINYDYGFERDEDMDYFEATEWKKKPKGARKDWHEKLGYAKDERWKMENAAESINNWSSGSGKYTRAQYHKALEDGRDLSTYAAGEAEIAKTIEGKAKIKSLLKEADDMEDFISRAPRYKGQIHRGVRMELEDLDEFIDGFIEGQRTATMESWSTNMAMAEEFAGLDKGVDFGDFVPKGKWKAPGNNAHVIMSVLDNKIGVPIKNMSSLAFENEVLMPSNVRYRLVDIQMSSARGTTEPVYQLLLEQIL